MRKSGRGQPHSKTWRIIQALRASCRLEIHSLAGGLLLPIEFRLLTSAATLLLLVEEIEGFAGSALERVCLADNGAGFFAEEFSAFGHVSDDFFGFLSGFFNDRGEDLPRKFRGDNALGVDAHVGEMDFRNADVC